MSISRLALPAVLAVLAALPIVFGGQTAESDPSARRVIIYTPHNEQIRFEFGRAFSDWHRRTYGEPASVAWNFPGGTSEIRRILEANASAALRDGRPIGGNADLVFGGGSYEYGQLKREVSIGDGETKRSGRILEKPSFDAAWLADTYGQNQIGDSPIYDPDGYWYGTALSGFGIVYNRDFLRVRGLDEPTEWANLADARLAGATTLVNPAQSGSVKTALEAIIQRLGWERGWQVIRRMSANARSVAASALKVPLDVSAGDSAAGLCIDFYGRYQWQAISDAGDPDRLGYVDPPGQTVIDPDPIAMLANAPNRETAERFIRFVLSDEGQALWQFHAKPRGEGELGPHVFELRRMPVKRSFIAKYRGEFLDDIDPYTLASAVKDPDRNARAFIAPLFSAICADRRDELARAWKAIREHPAYPVPKDGKGTLVTAADVTDPTLRAMLEAFDSMPVVVGPDGEAHDLRTREGRAAVADGYLARSPKWKGTGLWPDGATPVDELRRLLGAHASERYAEVVALARGKAAR